ncbi:MAG TPA: tetratricopeptide repeat protein, partial [Verrucomicrobiae bacterium]|nr:tetratricopeptide repeat protein [Verrucomicrobiae bacterium]
MVDKKNRKLIRGALFLAIVLVFAGCTPPGPRALLEGKKLIDAGRYDEAVGQLQVATSLLATNAQAWNYLGLAYHHAGQASNAVPAYQQALRLDHDLTEAHFNLGCLWLEQNKLDLAKTEFNAVTLRRANSADGWLKLGETQTRLRDLAGAEKSYNQVLYMTPQQPDALNGLGMVALQRNRPRDAAQFFNSAIKAKPDYAPALLNLAIVDQAYLGDRQAALQRYRDYLAVTPTPPDAEAVSATVRVLEQQLTPAARLPAANPVAQAALHNEPPRVTSNTTAIVASAKSDTAPSSKPVAAHQSPVNQPADRATMRPVVKTEPVSNPPVETNTAAISSTNQPLVVNSPPPKRGFFERINPFHSRSDQSSVTPLPPSKGTSGITPLPATTNTFVPPPAAIVPTKSTEAPATASARYKYHSPNPVVGNRAASEQPFANGLQAHHAGKYTEAVQDYLQAVHSDPSYFEAQYNLGLASASAGNLGQSLVAYEYCLALRPDSADARYNFALVLKRAGYFVDAAQELEKILVRYPLEVRAHLAAGNLYAEQLHQPAQAREHYSKVLELDPRNSQATA